MRILVALAFLTFSISVSAQGTIKGKLTDSAAKTNLVFATVTVFSASDTTLITYRLSNQEGDFRVPGLPLNTDLRAVISFTGYEVFRKDFRLTDDTPLDLSTVYMTPTSRSLEEIMIIAERPPVTVKRDTIEFNANSFKTLPTALVEDLLKKLPGIQVDPDGSITANGKRVNRILVDGKAFFGDDPKMATRNLPANVIDKVQVTDDKEEANRNISGDLTNVGQVINLTLKKGIKKGWFGKVYAGTGTRDRYEAGGIANIYRDTLQLSILGFSNNINRSGFSMKEVQELGGFNRSGSNSMMMMNRGGQTGFAINGISFGGLEPGIARTSGGGFNLNHAPNKNKSFFLQYFYGNTVNHLDQVNHTRQFIRDETITNRTASVNDKASTTHNLSGGFKLSPDSVTNIDFRSTFSNTSNMEDILSNILVDNIQAGRISKGLSNQFNDHLSNRYNHNLFITRRSRQKKGRALNISNFVNYGRVENDFITEATNEYYSPAFSEIEFNRLRRQLTPTWSVSSNVSISEPLSAKLTLRFNNRHEFIKDKNDIETFLKNQANAKYDEINLQQSSGFEREQNKYSSYIGLNYKISKVTLSAGLSGMYQTINNRFKNIPDVVHHSLFNILPSMNLQWKQLSANYSLNVNAPAISHLIPVPDSTNPFYIRFGNPYLTPTRQHQIYISNFNFFQGSTSTINMWLNATFIDNDVIMSRTILPSGVQVDRPVHADGTIQLYSSVGYGKEYKNKQKFIFNYRLSPNFNFNRRKLIINQVMGTATTLGYGPSINLGFNWNDVVELRPLYNYNRSRVMYTDASIRSMDVQTHYAEGELIVRLPKKLVWETNVAYRKATQVAPGLPATNILWNAAVTLLMLKGDVGLLKLSVFDLLNRNNGYFQYASQNSIVENQANVLNRYSTLSFTYNIRNMGAPKKVGGRDRLFMF